MKYSYLKSTTLKEFAQKKLDGGLNVYNCAELISDNQMSSGYNVFFKNGKLSSRKGLSFNQNNAVGYYDNFGHLHKGLIITDTVVSISETMYKIAYTLWGDYSSYQTLYIYLLSPSGGTSLTGSFAFHRTSSDIYYSFSNIIFLVGSRKKGSGIYAFLTLASGAEKIYEIYELNADHNEWLRLSEEDYYIPVVQMNGRGNLYSDAALEGNVFSEATTHPESYNILTGRFKSYFTSDGHSYQFKLPVSKLSLDSTILCRIYTTPSYYDEWIIPAGQESVVTQTGGGSITMRCYRNTGYISFYNDQSAVYAQPLSYNVNGNNMLVEATRFDSADIGSVVGSKNCRVYNSNAYFYGNSINPDNIYSVRVSNPLYFPENMKTSVGNPTDRVTAMAVQNNKLIAFKSNEIYKVSIKSSDISTGFDTLLGNSTSVFASDRLSCSLVHGSIGCSDKNTLAVCGNRLVWLGADNSVYTLATTTYGKENNVYCLSTPIDALLKGYDYYELSKAFAFDCDGYYVLYIAGKLYLLDYQIKNFGISSVYTALKDDADSISWYVLNLPELKYFSGFSADGQICLSCADSDLEYTALGILSEKEDEILVYRNGHLEKDTLPIESLAVSKYFDMGCPHTKKNIEEIYINMDFCGTADIIISDGSINHTQTVLSRKESLSLVKIWPFFKGTYGVSIGVCSKVPISINAIYIKYRELS